MEVLLLSWSDVQELYENENEDLKDLLSFNFYIKGLTRSALQEYSRHRSFSTSCRSSRYTLKKDLKEELEFTDFEKDKDRASKYIRFTGNESVDKFSLLSLENLRLLVNQGVSNDELKYAMPECYRVDLAMTTNFEGLYNFLKLRTSPQALKEIRELAYKIYEIIPEEVKHLFSTAIYKEPLNDE